MFLEMEQFIDWMRMCSPQAKTWRDYRCDLALFISMVGDRAVEEIRPQEIDRFVNFQIARGYKPSTVNRRLAAVVSFYRCLIKEGRAVPSPVLPKRHYLRQPQRLPRPVNEQDLRRFFLSVTDIRDRAMFALMLHCGLRIGEVSILEMTDLCLGELPAHRLHHTYATQLPNVGCRVTSIQKLLGHTDLNTTMTYARAFDQTVMQDYFQALDILESQPDGAWFGLNEIPYPE